MNNIVYNKPELKVLNSSKGLRRMTFLIEGLEEGKAETLVTAIRRNLIGFTPGLAPAAIKILGASQLYAPIKGLVHDTNDLSILIKELKVLALDPTTGEVANQFVLEINRTYSNEVIKFGDFQLAPGYTHLNFKVLNPEKVLTYVGEENVPVNIKVLIQAGVGYSAYNVLNKKENVPEEFIDSIAVDSLFSPIVHVSYDVKKQTPKPQEDSILLTVETTGALTPLEAVYMAAETMKADAEMLIDLFDVGVNTYDVMLNVKHSDSEQLKPNDISEGSEIEVLNLPTDIYDLVKDQSLNSIGALVNVLNGTQFENISDMRANKEILARKDEIISYLEKAGFILEEQ